MSPADLSLLPTLPPISRGSHTSRKAGMCIMEAVAYVAGEPHSDEPTCVSPSVIVFQRSWNDDLPDDATRDRLLRDLIPEMIGTRTTDADEQTRAFLAMDWLLRDLTPTFLDLVPALAPHALALRQQPEIVDVETLKSATGTVVAARAAASDAARAAAGDAARAAASDAARAAAGAAARAVAWTAAGAVVGAVASAAALAAARAVAWTAAVDTLNQTVSKCQDSARALVRRMCAVGRTIDARQGRKEE